MATTSCPEGWGTTRWAQELGLGNDLLTGNDGADILNGGFGDDRLSGGFQDDSLNGGADVDRLEESGNANFTLTNSSLTGLGTDTLTAIESVSLSGASGNNALDASGATIPVVLDGGAGDDVLQGGTSADALTRWNRSQRAHGRHRHRHRHRSGRCQLHADEYDPARTGNRHARNDRAGSAHRRGECKHPDCFGVRGFCRPGRGRRRRRAHGSERQRFTCGRRGAQAGFVVGRYGLHADGLDVDRSRHGCAQHDGDRDVDRWLGEQRPRCSGFTRRGDPVRRGRQRQPPRRLGGGHAQRRGRAGLLQRRRRSRLDSGARRGRGEPDPLRYGR